MPVDIAMSRDTSARTLASVLGLPHHAAASTRVSGIAYDSRQVRSGSLFFALPGVKSDGADFAPQAIRNGARGAYWDILRQRTPAHP